jgi:hypothetical protein
MKEEQLTGLDQRQKIAIAVAYLLSNKADRPAETLSLFCKLETYETQAASLNEQIQSAKRMINEHSSKIQQFIGSLTAVADLIGEMLPEDKVKEWCLAYNMPKEMNAKMIQPALQPSQPTPDMAGATSKMVPPVDLKSLSEGK